MIQGSQNAVQTGTQEAYQPVTYGIPERATGANNTSHCPTPCLPGQTASVCDGSVSRVQMILPQVHLRKPCYDFSFL